MRRFEERIAVSAPTGGVYDYVSDFKRHEEWSGNGLEVTQEGDGPIQVGTTFATVAKQFGTQRERSTVAELSRGVAFAWDSRGALGTVHHRFAMADDGGSTVLTKSAEFTQPSFLAKLTGWKLSKDVPAGLRSDLIKIKERLETPSS
jgi:hypothetical protein